MRVLADGSIAAPTIFLSGAYQPGRPNMPHFPKAAHTKPSGPGIASGHGTADVWSEQTKESLSNCRATKARGSSAPAMMAAFT